MNEHEHDRKSQIATINISLHSFSPPPQSIAIGHNLPSLQEKASNRERERMASNEGDNNNNMNNDAVMPPSFSSSESESVVHFDSSTVDPSSSSSSSSSSSAPSMAVGHLSPHFNTTTTSTTTTTLALEDSSDKNAATNNNNNDVVDALLETFLDAHAAWKFYVDKMMELENHFEKTAPPPLCTESVTGTEEEEDVDVVVHPIHYMQKLLLTALDDDNNEMMQDTKVKEKGKNEVMDRRGELVEKNDVQEVNDNDNDRKLQSTVETKNTTTTTSSSSSLLPSSSSSSSQAISLEELSKALFQPGMQFQGRITIPGLSGERLRNTFALSVNEDDSEEEEEEEEDEDEYDEDEDEDDEDAMEFLSHYDDNMVDEGEMHYGPSGFAEWFDRGEGGEETEEEENDEDEDDVDEEDEEQGNINDTNNSNNDTMDAFRGANQAVESAEGVISDPPAADPIINQESSHTSQDGAGGIPYELTIIQMGTDPLGNDFIQAKHSAYNDEQVVHIQISIVNVDENQSECGARRKLQISYEDGETVCKGQWNPDKFRLEGHVYQRAITNDGIFHTSDSATHVFTLYPCTFCFPRERDGKEERTGFGEKPVDLERDLLSKNTRAIVAHRSRIQDALHETLRRYFELSQSLSLGSTQGSIIYYSRLVKQKEVISKIRGCNWEGILNGYFLRSEQISSEFRRRAVLLNSLSFESTEDQLRCIEHWKEAKMDLAAAHEVWDEWSGQIKGLVLFDNEGSVLEPWLASQRRIHLSFESLESAYQRASARLPRSDLAKYEIPCTLMREEILDNACIICQSPLLDEENHVYELPCSHVFHKACAQQWLHDNLSCPMCRFDLSRNMTI